MGFVKRFGEFFPKNSKIFFSLQDLAVPLDIFIVPHFVGFVKGFFTFFLRGNTRLSFRLSLQDTHLAMALLGLSP